jgi:uncharacterized flavoprotein (TIGR03862 family)
MRDRTAIVVGGGPAGLMAAETMAKFGLAVTVYEHHRSPGRKFLLAGRSGLNLTNSESIDDLVARYSAESPAIEAAVRTFGPDDVRAWASSLGESSFVGSSGRVFPTSIRAAPLLRAWLRRLTSLGVVFETGSRWIGWSGDGRLEFSHADGQTACVDSDVVVFALGGASWRRTGSTGDWVGSFRSAGIEVTDLEPANCGVMIPWSDHFGQRFAGHPLKNVEVFVDNRGVRGDAMVTASGLEGSPIYAQSELVRRSIRRTGSCVTRIDLQPDLSVERLEKRLRLRRPKDSLTTALRKTVALAPSSIGLMRESVSNDLPTDVAALARLIKNVCFTIRASMPIDRAISSAGGVALSEVDGSFMLRRMPGTYVIGEMLDWEAPTGGYLLQGCFSTAVVAAMAATE